MPTWTIPWPVGISTNSLYVHTRRGVRLSERARAWRDEVIVIVRQSDRYAEGLPAGKLALTLRTWDPADGRRHDGDNLCKLASDSICAAYGIDDSRIREWHVYQHRAGEGWEPCIQARVEPASWQGEPLTPTGLRAAVGVEEG